MIGTSNASAALKTFSDRREMLGGQSRKTWSYRFVRGRTTRARLRPGSLAASSTTSRFRNEKSDGMRSRPGKSVGVIASATSTFPRTSDFPRLTHLGRGPEVVARRALGIEVEDQRAGPVACPVIAARWARLTTVAVFPTPPFTL